jgi:hypothetical protein
MRKLLAGAALIAAIIPSSASAVMIAPPKPSKPGIVDHVYWLRTLWGQKYEFWRSGPVVGGFIMGGVLVASAIAQHRATEDAVRSCAEDFPGFDPRTGTFLNEDGERRVCPYLY